jgi:hypothetical protein
VPGNFCFYFVFEIRSCSLFPGWSQTHDPPASASRVPEIIGTYHHTLLLFPYLQTAVIFPDLIISGSGYWVKVIHGNILSNVFFIKVSRIVIFV